MNIKNHACLILEILRKQELDLLKTQNTQSFGKERNIKKEIGSLFFLYSIFDCKKAQHVNLYINPWNTTSLLTPFLIG